MRASRKATLTHDDVMEHQIATRLSLDSAGATGPASEVSQPISMAGGNAVQVAVTMLALTATNVSFQVQESNDNENWSDKGSPDTLTVVGYKKLAAITSVTAAYARVKYTVTGSGKAILVASLTVSQQ